MKEGVKDHDLQRDHVHQTTKTTEGLTRVREGTIIIETIVMIGKDVIITTQTIARTIAQTTAQITKELTTQIAENTTTMIVEDTTEIIVAQTTTIAMIAAENMTDKNAVKALC